MASKSKVACEFSIEQMPGENKVYMWTFTFAECLPITEARKRFSKLHRALRRAGYRYFRVYEMHKSHGLHEHGVTPDRWDVNRIREITTRHGFGRINVKRKTRERALYVAKYLTKQRRKPCLKSVRMWGAVNIAHTKVKDVRICTPEADAIRTLIKFGMRFHDAVAHVKIHFWHWICSEGDSRWWQQQPLMGLG